VLRRLLAALSLAIAVVLAAAPALAGQIIDQAAASLRRDPVFVDPSAERAISGSDADQLRTLIGSSEMRAFRGSVRRWVHQ